MNAFKSALTFLLCVFFKTAISQVSGYITNKDNEVLAFATVYVEGTTIGTASNIEGYYQLKLDPGEYTLRFQYIGYGSFSKLVRIIGETGIQMDVILKPEAIELEEIVLSADAEDPAYDVIRNAIKQRKYHLNQIEEYRTNAYVKGLIKVIDAPEKFLGMNIGDMEGILDTSRQGIIYLSESESELYYKAPDQIKEVMISSKVSGDDQGFSFNRASAVIFNLYKNTVRFGRKLISPIADNAMASYKYRLKGTYLDREDRLVNVIEVIPKRTEAPCYFGTIYITEDLWNIQKADLKFTSKAVNQSFFDTIGFKQLYVQIQPEEAWPLFSQTIDFNAHFFSFHFGGAFTYIFNDYNLSPEFPEGFFNNELLKVQEGANEKDSVYWKQIRPIPLTKEEVADYHKKDSLKVVWESKEYLDSLDREDNKFKLLNLIFGYTYSKRFRKRYYRYRSPLSTFQFNPVQGFVLGTDLEIHQNYDQDRKFFEINPAIQYGFSDKQWRPSLRLNWKSDAVKNTRITLEGGRKVAQFNSKASVMVNLNTWTSLFGKNNLLKLYDKRYLMGGYSSELVNGLRFSGEIHWENRKPLVNQSNYSFFNKDNIYKPNIPSNSYFGDDQVYLENTAFILDFKVDLAFDQKYFSYPKQRFIFGSQYPKLTIQYRKAFKILGSDTEFDYLIFNIWDRRLETGKLGFSRFNFEAGISIDNEDIDFVDYKHFLGNELHIAKSQNYFNGFKILPNYQYSTNKSWISFQWEQHFEGLILDFIPLIKNTNLKSVAGVSTLFTKGRSNYWEFSYGIENISLGPASLFRIDYVVSVVEGEIYDKRIVVGLSQLLSSVL